MHLPALACTSLHFLAFRRPKQFVPQKSRAEFPERPVSCSLLQDAAAIRVVCLPCSVNVCLHQLGPSSRWKGCSAITGSLGHYPTSSSRPERYRSCASAPVCRQRLLQDLEAVACRQGRGDELFRGRCLCYCSNARLCRQWQPREPTAGRQFYTARTPHSSLSSFDLYAYIALNRFNCMQPRPAATHVRQGGPYRPRPSNKELRALWEASCMIEPRRCLHGMHACARTMHPPTRTRRTHAHKRT